MLPVIAIKTFGYVIFLLFLAIQDTFGIRCNQCAYNSQYEEGFPTVVGIPMSKKCLSEPEKTTTCEITNGHCFKRVAHYPSGKQLEVFYGCEPRSLGCQHKTTFPEDGTYALKFCCWSGNFCNNGNRLMEHSWIFVLPVAAILSITFSI